jgi:hypothetical protein
LFRGFAIRYYKEKYRDAIQQHKNRKQWSKPLQDVKVSPRATLQQRPSSSVSPCLAWVRGGAKRISRARLSNGNRGRGYDGAARAGEDRIGSAHHSLRDAPGMTRVPGWSRAGPSSSRTRATRCSCRPGPMFLLLMTGRGWRGWAVPLAGKRGRRDGALSDTIIDSGPGSS